MLANTEAATSIVLALVGLAGGFVSFLKWGLPAWRKNKAARRAEHDAIVGRPPILDSVTGKEIAPALPGIGVRMEAMELRQANSEEHLGKIAEALTAIADDSRRLDNHEARIAQLERQTLERAGMHFEAGKAFEAMGKIADGKSADEALE